MRHSLAAAWQERHKALAATVNPQHVVERDREESKPKICVRLGACFCRAKMLTLRSCTAN